MELTKIERALAALFPELAVAPLRTREKGFGSVAVETSDGVIFRIARHARAARGHAIEARLLPVLRDRIPVAVPDPRWRVEPGTGGLVHGAIGYRRLPGQPLSPERPALADSQQVASELAGFLGALHRFPVVEAEALRLPRADTDGQQFEALQDEVLPLLRERLIASEYTSICRWCEEVVSDRELDRFEPALRHGDFWYGNVLVDGEGAISGVVDWENAAIGDRATDLARQLHLGRPFASEVLRMYAAHGGHVDSRLEHRIERRWELLEFAGIRAAIELDDAEELEETIAKLRTGPVLSRGR